jgi:hypothetical protein
MSNRTMPHEATGTGLLAASGLLTAWLHVIAVVCAIPMYCYHTRPAVCVLCACVAAEGHGAYDWHSDYVSIAVRTGNVAVLNVLLEGGYELKWQQAQVHSPHPGAGAAPDQLSKLPCVATLGEDLRSRACMMS